MFQAKKAKRQRRPLKVSLEGLSGGGKTYTALRMAFDMMRRGIGKRIVVLDSENESASLYAGVVEDGTVWDYDVADIPPAARNPAGYTAAYEWAVGEGFDIVIIDSLSHAWHGALQDVDRYAASHKGDKLGGWAALSPQQQKMIQTLTDPRAHCICTMRVKSEFQDEEVNGKKRKVKVGMKADQRDNTEYEYDIVIRFEAGNDVFVEKVRGCSAMNGRGAVRPGPDFWKPLYDWWLSADPVVGPEEKARQEFRRAATLDDLVAAWGRVPAGVKPAVLADKDRRKAELQAGGDRQIAAVAGHELVAGDAATDRTALESRVEAACHEAGYDDPDVGVRVHAAVLDAHDGTGRTVHWRDLSDAQLAELLTLLG